MRQTTRHETRDEALTIVKISTAYKFICNYFTCNNSKKLLMKSELKIF
ncbi:hypothetical protein HMPREF0541_00613 [Lacticaseibacillus rhamnosus ATCC 21052]|nr:hypothetical protein HMPREF0541_00613 [Lacticaseibacillus rhamnosus ATCC 21052]